VAQSGVAATYAVEDSNAPEQVGTRNTDAQDFWRRYPVEKERGGMKSSCDYLLCDQSSTK